MTSLQYPIKIWSSWQRSGVNFTVSNKKKSRKEKKMSDGVHRPILSLNLSPVHLNPSKTDKSEHYEERPQWEYTSEYLYSSEENEKVFNRLGKEGWELVNFTETSAYFKRPLITKE